MFACQVLVALDIDGRHPALRPRIAFIGPCTIKHGIDGGQIDDLGLFEQTSALISSSSTSRLTGGKARPARRVQQLGRCEDVESISVAEVSIVEHQEDLSNDIADVRLQLNTRCSGFFGLTLRSADAMLNVGAAIGRVGLSSVVGRR